MGEMYSPEIHWTSSLRRKAGLRPFTGNEIEASTFTIREHTASLAFTDMLVRMGHQCHRRLDHNLKAPVYHIEVVTTEEDLKSRFVLEPFQVQKVSFCLQFSF
jgi:hypothetical protein